MLRCGTHGRTREPERFYLPHRSGFRFPLSPGRISKQSARHTALAEHSSKHCKHLVAYLFPPIDSELPGGKSHVELAQLCNLQAINSHSEQV